VPAAALRSDIPPQTSAGVLQALQDPVAPGQASAALVPAGPASVTLALPSDLSGSPPISACETSEAGSGCLCLRHLGQWTPTAGSQQCDPSHGWL